MTFLELAQTILKEAKTPLAPTEIWQTAVDKGYDKQLNSNGKTPWATLSTEIYVSVRDNPKSPFQGTDSRPKKFFLKSQASQLDFNKKEPRQIREDYDMTENSRETTGHLRDEEIDVLAFVYIAQNIRREGVLKKNVADDYRFPKKYLENLIQNGEIEEKRAVRYFDVYTTTRKGNELIKPVVVARLENAAPQIKSILDSLPEGVFRYLIEQVALSDVDEGRSLKNHSEEKDFRNYNDYAFCLLNDDRLKSFRENLFNEFEDMGLAVKVNDYVSTEGGKIRDKYFVLAPELEEFLKEYIYGRKYKKPLFLPQYVKMIELFRICHELTYYTHDKSWLEYEVKNKPISCNEVQDAVDELVNEGLIIVKNNQLWVSDKRTYPFAMEERFIKPVVDYLLAKQPIVVQETPPTASVKESRIEGKKPNKIEAERQIQAVSQETNSQEGVLVGFECGTGKPVRIKPAHLFISGLTQKAGKTTTLEALIQRSSLSAVSFITKPGEKCFDTGEYHKPYFQEKVEWRVIEKLFESLLDEKMKDVRPKLIELCKELTEMSKGTLQALKQSIDEALEGSKGSEKKSLILLQAYLEDLFNTLKGREYTSTLNLKNGINLMDLTGYSEELQNYIINSTLNEILLRHEKTVVVIPEAWKFIPQSKRTPCKYSVEQLMRQGAAKGNFVWFDSQDIAGVDKAILKNVSVWLLGLQNEINEVRHTIDQIPLQKKQKPSEDQIMSLKIGEFFVCADAKVTKTYVMPKWMDENDAKSNAVLRSPFNRR